MRWSRLSIGAIAGGAVGNVIDRLRYGAVVDFIHAHVGEWSWYVFNVADAAIVCGVAALVLESQLFRRPRPPKVELSGLTERALETPRNLPLEARGVVLSDGKLLDPVRL